MGMLKEIKRKVEKEIQEDLIQKIKSLEQFDDIDYDDFTGELYNLFGQTPFKDKTIAIKSLLEAKPLFVVNKMIPYLTRQQVEIKCDLLPDHFFGDFRDKRDFRSTIRFICEEFSILTDISSPSLKFTHDTGEDISSNINTLCDVDHWNHFSGEAFIKCDYNLGLEISNILYLDYMDISMSCDVQGLLKNSDIPSWLEYLIEGCVHAEYKNDKMALFNLFAALDKFIEILNHQVFEYYIENYNKLLDFTADKISEIIVNWGTQECSFEEEALDYIKEFLQSKIKEYSNDRRRISEKFIQILKEIGIKGDNEEFRCLYNHVSKFKDIEKLRNSIGHGEKVNDEFDVSNVLYSIFTIILSICTYRDIEKNDWECFIYYDE